MPASALELGGFRQWLKSDGFPPGVRATFVDGEVILDMSPERIESHSKVKGQVTSVLERFVEERDLGETYPDGTLLSHPSAGLSTEPDFMFAAWETLTSGRLHKIPSAQGDDFIELEGTPDLVVEVVSPSSVRKDLVVLRAAYERARIPEYWTIDARHEQVRFEILLLVNDRYTPSSAGDVQHSAVLEAGFRLRREKNRIAHWRYRLNVLTS